MKVCWALPYSGCVLLCIYPYVCFGQQQEADHFRPILIKGPKNDSTVLQGHVSQLASIPPLEEEIAKANIPAIFYQILKALNKKDEHPYDGKQLKKSLTVQGRTVVDTV